LKKEKELIEFFCIEGEKQ